MKVHTQIGSLVAICLIFVFATVAQAQTTTPDVQVSGSGVVEGEVTIVQATVDGPGWVVIHTDDEGKPGPVIGHAPLEEGINTDVVVEIDTDAATPILHAMLHVDEGEVGVYEFPGPDGPVTIEDDIVMARFSASPVPAEVDQTDAPATVPPTGAGVSLSLIMAVIATTLAGLGASVAVARRGRA